MLSTLEVLRSARKLLSNPKRWNKASLERLRDGETCYCALGAIGAASGLNLNSSEGRNAIYGSEAPTSDSELVATEAVRALAKQLPKHRYHSPADTVWNWNDGSTTYEEVMAAFSKACEAEFEKEQEVAVSC